MSKKTKQDSSNRTREWAWVDREIWTERMVRYCDDFVILKGWFCYFQHAHRREFPAVDGFVRRRLRAILRKQTKRPGRGRCQGDHRRWPNAFFAEQGLFTITIFSNL